MNKVIQRRVKKPKSKTGSNLISNCQIHELPIALAKQIIRLYPELTRGPYIDTDDYDVSDSDSDSASDSDKDDGRPQTLADVLNQMKIPTDKYKRGDLIDVLPGGDYEEDLIPGGDMTDDFYVAFDGLKFVPLLGPQEDMDWGDKHWSLPKEFLIFREFSPYAWEKARTWNDCYVWGDLSSSAHTVTQPILTYQKLEYLGEEGEFALVVDFVVNQEKWQLSILIDPGVSELTLKDLQQDHPDLKEFVLNKYFSGVRLFISMFGIHEKRPDHILYVYYDFD